MAGRLEGAYMYTGKEKRAVGAVAGERRDVTPVGSVATHQRRFHLSPVNESLERKDHRHDTVAVPASRFRVSLVQTSPVAAPQKKRFCVSTILEQNRSMFQVTLITNSSISDNR